MKTKPEQLKELLSSINYPHLMDIIDSPWYINRDSVYWNTDDNLEHLACQEGNTYGGYLPEGVAEWQGYTVANHDTQCGQWVTLLLDNKRKVTVEELEEMFDCDVY